MSAIVRSCPLMPVGGIPLPKLNVVGSSPISRSNLNPWDTGV